MRNFKKVLSLVLCMAMMLSVMVVGAGAAFKDQEKINNAEAVDACAALNIINGYTDGSFRPEGTITRAEACKMICVALNGGKEPVLGTNATASFTDIKGHWAEGYIEYCVSEGIVAGIGGGKFNPNGNVTGSQFAKMLLIALGYRADHEKFVGNAWEVNVNVKASQKALYEDLEAMDPSVALTRDNAAQMVWNALQAKEVEYDYTLATENGQLVSKVTVKDINKTLMEDKYDTKDTDKTTGILTGISYNTTKEEYTYTISSLDAKHALNKIDSYTTEADYTDLLGHNVTFVVKNNNDKDVYGAYAKDSVTVVSGLMDDIGYDDVKTTSGKLSGSIEVADTDYDIDSEIAVIEYSAVNHKFVEERVSSLAAVKALSPYYEFSAIDWDDDDDIDLIIVYPVDFGKVTYVGSDYVRVAVVNESKENVNMATPEVTSTTLDTKNAEDYTLYEGAAKDDYALISADTSLKTLGTITELVKQTGKVTSTSKNTAVIGGDSYDISCQTSLKSARNTTVDFRTINNFVVWSDASNTVDVSDYVLVTGITGSTASSGYYKADLLFSDGTTATADIKSVDGVAKGAQGYNNTPNVAEAGTLWEYEISSGRYELTSLPETNLSNGAEGFDLWLNNSDKESDADYWQGAKKASDADAKVAFADNNKAKFDSSAVVFVRDDDDFSVKTGADLAKVTGAAKVLYAGAEENDNGYNYVTFAYVETGSVSSSDEVYGFITSDITVTENSDGTFYSFTAWNGTEYADLTTVDVTSNDFSGTTDNLGTLAAIENGTAALAKQAIISYKLDADGAVTDLEVLTGTVSALTAYDGDDIMVGGEAYTTDKDDTTFLYIDRDGKKGETSGVYSVADKVDSALTTDPTGIYTAADGTKYYANVMVYRAATSGDLDLVVVDVTNDWFAVNQ